MYLFSPQHPLMRKGLVGSTKQGRGRFSSKLF
jgi:hypothetical protein